jgi:glycosyltransferase involved in cell wall biosynthesis
MSINLRNKKILYVSQKAGFFGGVERYIFDTASILTKNGCAVSGLFFENARDLELFSEPFQKIFRQADVESVLSSGDFDMAFIHKVDSPELVKALRAKFKTVVFVHDHDYYCLRRHKYFPFKRINCSLPFNPVYCSLCSGMIQRSGSGFKCLNVMERVRLLHEIRKCDAFMVMSGFMRDNLIMNKFSKDSIFKIYPVRHLSRFESEDELPDKKPVIIYVGQLIRGKGVDLMLQALAMLEVDYKAVIVGSNKDDEFLKALAKQLGIADKVEFAGWQTEPERFWKEADIAVFPSRWQEPFGLAGIEAFAHKIPVVGFDVGGVSEWLRDNENGIMVPEKDIAAMADALLELLGSPEAGKRLGANGYRYVKEHFSEENFVGGFELMLDIVLGGQGDYE